MTAASAFVPRCIESWTQDEGGEWVAQLDCGHRRHVRHRPPLASFPWVETAAGREAHVGAQIECDRCLRRVWPEGLEPYRVTRDFDEHTVPNGLLARHTTKAGTWGLLEVLEGRVALLFEAPLDDRVELGAGEHGAIPPQLPHHLELEGPVRLRVRFFRMRAPADPLAPGHE